MNIQDPYTEDEKESAASSTKPTPKKKESKEKEVPNIYGDFEIEEDGEDENRDDSLEGDGEEFDEEIPWFKKPPVILGLAVAGIALLAVIYFVFIKKDPPPPPVTEEVVEQPNQAEVLKGELYKMGIGKEAINETNIYEQGPLESADFRKDFVNTDSGETYVLPIDIIAVNDSVSYTKHRTMTDDGMDMYWVDAVYKSKKTRFTVPYYIWQTLAPQGVMDVVAEVVTDAEGKTFVTSITPVPPSGGN